MNRQVSRSFTEKWSKLEGGRKYGQSQEEFVMMLEQLTAMLGVKGLDGLRGLFTSGMNVLDVGCGMAWAEIMFNECSEANRFAVDFAEGALNMAWEYLRRVDNIFLTQADLFNLPFGKEFFDIIFSGGVLHHTPDPEGGLKALCWHLKPGGLIGIYIYCLKPMLREMADREVRRVTTEMSFEECAEFAEQMACLGRSFRKLDAELVVDRNVPLLGIETGRYPLQKFIYDHFLKCFWNGEAGMEYSKTVNFDWYRPKLASHHTRKEVVRWFEEAEIEDIMFIQPKRYEHSGFFVSGRKRRC